jgi:hypothetical protein
MYAFDLLEVGCHYLIQEHEDEGLSLVRINLVSDHCVYVSYFGAEEEILWKRKTDKIHDIVELLDNEALKSWETYYNKDAFNYEEDED